MSNPPYKTPGVYVKELSAFPPTVIGVATAVPGFIGYTEKATINGKPVFNKAIPISSLAEYDQIFGKGIKPLYAIKAATEADYDFKADTYYKLERSSLPFNLYDSMRLFYDNGGGSCYVVSVGCYGPGEGSAAAVAKRELETGLDVLREQSGPTMIVIPDAVNLAPDTDYYDVAKKALDQCAELQDRVALLDVYGAQNVKTSAEPLPVIEDLRKNVGNGHLSYGMVYFPFVQATVFPVRDVSYTNVRTSGVLSSANGGGVEFAAASSDPCAAAVAAALAAVTPPVPTRPGEITVDPPSLDPFQNLKEVLTWQRKMLYEAGRAGGQGPARHRQHRQIRD